MGWTVFTIIDLVVGVVLLEALAPSVPTEKRKRLGTARKVVYGLLAISILVLLMQIALRYGWLRP